MSIRIEKESERPALFTRGLYALYGLWFAVLFALLAAFTLCLIALVPGQARRRSIARLGARILFLLTGAWPRIEGLEHLPTGPAVVVANHASYLDGILLTAVLPSDYRFVIKSEVTKVPLMNFYLQRIGAHFVERFDPNKGARDTRRIMQTAANGDSLAFFPEGTFRNEPGLRRFHSGAFKVASRQQLPLVPLTINGTRDMLPADRLLPRPVALHVVISPPLTMTPGADTAAALSYCRSNILRHLDEPDLQPLSAAADGIAPQGQHR